MVERQVEDGAGFCERDANSYGEDNETMKDCIHID